MASLAALTRPLQVYPGLRVGNSSPRVQCDFAAQLRGCTKLSGLAGIKETIFTPSTESSVTISLPALLPHTQSPSMRKCAQMQHKDFTSPDTRPVDRQARDDHQFCSSRGGVDGHISSLRLCGSRWVLRCGYSHQTIAFTEVHLSQGQHTIVQNEGACKDMRCRIVSKKWTAS